MKKKKMEKMTEEDFLKVATSFAIQEGFLEGGESFTECEFEDAFADEGLSEKSLKLIHSYDEGGH